MSETKVANIRDSIEGIYIGRAGKGQDGYFGNPYRSEDRATNLEKFRTYFIKRLMADGEFYYRVGQLKGKTLICFCSPLPCHGNVIAEFLDSVDYDFHNMQQRAHENSINKGFWKASSDIPTKLMLIVTEIAEAMEDYRKNKMDVHYELGGKPTGFPTELADSVIRLMDLAEYLDINLAREINEKMDFNDSREYLHGGRRV